MLVSVELREKAQRFRQMALRITDQQIAQAIYELASEYDEQADLLAGEKTEIEIY